MSAITDLAAEMAVAVGKVAEAMLALKTENEVLRARLAKAPVVGQLVDKAIERSGVHVHLLLGEPEMAKLRSAIEVAVDRAWATGIADGVESHETTAKETDELREAAGALLVELESSGRDQPVHCDNTHCWRLATLDDGDQCACDEHREMLVDGDIEERSYTPALRRLRALVEVKL